MARDLNILGQDAPDDMREILDYQYLIDPYNPWFSLAERKLNVPFIAKEVLWYVGGDREDHSIGEHAGVWRSVFEHDGRAVSNYGYQAFRMGGLGKVIDLLVEEPNTRRAIIYFGENDLVKTHAEVKDQPCANSIHFLVRRGILHTIISQRSQDFIYGVSGDAVIMAIFSNLVAAVLGIAQAPLRVQVSSFHHYPKHKEMMKVLPGSDVYQIEWPYKLLDASEALRIVDMSDLSGPFMQWWVDAASNS